MVQLVSFRCHRKKESMFGTLYAIILWKWELGQWKPQSQLIMPANPMVSPSQDEICKIASSQAGQGFVYASTMSWTLTFGSAPTVVKPACMAGPFGFTQPALWLSILITSLV